MPSSIDIAGQGPEALGAALETTAECTRVGAWWQGNRPSCHTHAFVASCTNTVAPSAMPWVRGSEHQEWLDRVKGWWAKEVPAMCLESEVSPMITT